MKRKLFLTVFSIVTAGAYARHAPLEKELKSDSAFERTAVAEASATNPPPNDECSGALTLTVNSDFSCGSLTSGTVTDATNSGLTTNNGNTADNDVWFVFTATATTAKVAVINALGNDTWLGWEVFEGSCGELTSLGSSNWQGLLLSNLNVGGVYYVRVFSVNTNSGSNAVFDVCVGTPPPPPANDDCGSAVALTVNPVPGCANMVFGTLTSATDSNVPSGLGQPDDDVWYSFTANATSQWIQFIGISGTQTDLVAEVLSGNCDGGLTSVGAFNFQQGIISGLTVGENYYLRIYTYFNISDVTDFVLCVAVPPPGPENDDCESAGTLTVNPDFSCGAISPGTVGFATNSGIPATTGNPQNDVWFKFTAISDIQKISINGDLDFVHEVFSGDCEGGLTSILTSDFDVSVLTGLIPGETYYVRVFTFWSLAFESTAFSICVGTVPNAPVNDDCSGAIALGINPEGSCEMVTAGTVAGATDSGIAPGMFGGTPDDDVWFHFIATAENHTVALTNVSGGFTNLIIELFEGDCESLNAVVPFSFPLESNKLNLHNLIPGTPYYLRIYTATGELFPDTSFNVCLNVSPPPPVNDNCAQAISLTVNDNATCEAVTQGTITNATPSLIDGNENADDDVWYRFVATSDIHAISITNSAGSTDVLTIEVMDGDCNGLVSLGANNNKRLELENLSPGNTYYVRVYSVFINEQQVSFDLCLNIPPPVPDNDFCYGAMALTLDSDYCNGVNTNGDTTSATDSGLVPATCFGSGVNDLWYTFTVPADVVKVNVSTDFTGGTLLDTNIAVYSGSCDVGFSEIACDTDGGDVVLSNGESYLSRISGLDVNPEETYYIRVTGYASQTYGSFCVKVSTDETLSAGNIDADKLIAYPNPVKEVLTLSGRENIGSVALFNMLGQRVISQPVNAAVSRIEMSGLAAGVYIIKVISGGSVKTIRVNKE